ncbi:M15 family metallopeptidase [Nocardioides jishulii]|uniref:M15 family metallopeptidase n=1 Tax=Nocardioides jishulii TaxID=2575440 RepID=A0A4U2YJL1_9ACTN|nr:M15 family metallopeptidase [Nocardioides jishulii]QCX26835.1 M15 family metallopeptidase [Nocardioides jishulii]TKI61318.1 M15 family metallopeptidase [Nocardioides jishulii]
MRHVLVVILGTVLALLPFPAYAAEASPGKLGPAVALGVTSTPARSGEASTVTLALTPAPGAPESLTLERWNGTTWHRVTTVTTDEAGRAIAAVTLARDPARNRLRATLPGDATRPAVVTEHTPTLRRWGSTVTLRAPKSVVDEGRIILRLGWKAANAEAVSGWVKVQAKQRRGKTYAKKWRTVARVRTDAKGVATLQRTPRWDTRWRAVGEQQAWVAADTSGVSRTVNRPPGRPVALPQGAPRPRVTLPRPRRAVGKGANVVVRTIPDGVWRSMVGRSWRKGCPVGRSGLRLVQTNFWGFDGYRYRGEVVVAKSVTANFAGAFREMHERRIPVRQMRRVDRFGWSKKLGGADDYRSMAADNTSVFNCRGVVGSPRVRSPHSYGRSLDLNPWENPYHARDGIHPNRWWASRSHPKVAWRGQGHAVVRLLARHGFRWTYGTSDAHHFDAVAGAGGQGLRELLSSPACVDDVCH